MHLHNALLRILNERNHEANFRYLGSTASVFRECMPSKGQLNEKKTISELKSNDLDS